MVFIDSLPGEVSIVGAGLVTRSSTAPQYTHSRVSSPFEVAVAGTTVTHSP